MGYFEWLLQEVIALMAMLWHVVGAIWNTLYQFYQYVKPLFDQVAKLWKAVQGIALTIYKTYIQPVWNALQPLIEKVNAFIKYVDNLYSQTIGKIDDVYNKLFGNIEQLWTKISETGDRISHVVAKFDKDLADKIQHTLDSVESSTIGKIQGLRDEIDIKIQDAYAYIQTYAKDIIQSFNDVVGPIGDAVKRVEDFLHVTCEQPNLLAKDTITVSADTYGQEWWDTVTNKVNPDVPQTDINKIVGGDVYNNIEQAVIDLDAGSGGRWGDVADWIDLQNRRMDQGLDPLNFVTDESKLPPEEQTEYINIEKPPAHPGLIIPPGG